METVPHNPDSATGTAGAAGAGAAAVASSGAPADGATASSGAPVASHRVPLLELITKASCHLCEDARDVVAGIAGELGLPWQEVSIDDNAELTARYGEEIPVVMVDGIQRDFWHIDPVRLRKILLRAREVR